MDLRESGWGSVEWIQLAQDRDWWQILVNTVMNLRVLVPQISLRRCYLAPMQQSYFHKVVELFNNLLTSNLANVLSHACFDV
jgi:hypothetical protein